MFASQFFFNSRSPSPLVIVTTENDTTYSAFPVNRFEDDATSLYEYPDQPNSTIVNAQVPVEAHRHKTGPNGITYLQVNAYKFSLPINLIWFEQVLTNKNSYLIK